MSVLVDSSTWIDYFRGTGAADPLDVLIEEDLVVTNDLILAELIPFLHQKREERVIALLREVKRHPVAVDWDDIIQMQITCLRSGINGVGIPDLIIAQHAMHNRLHLLSADRHFVLMSEHMPLLIHRS